MDTAAPTLSVRAMVDAVAVLGVVLKKSQVHNDYKEGAPKHSARAFLAWRAAYRELGRTADSRIDRAQASAPIPVAAASASQEAEGGTGDKPSVGSGEAPPESDDEPVVDEHTLAFRRDRAANERIKSERAQLELDQMRGSLVPLRESEELHFTAARITRDRVLMVPARFSAEIHALVLSLVPEEQRAELARRLDLHEFERRHEAVLRDALEEAAKAIAESGHDDDPDD